MSESLSSSAPKTYGRFLGDNPPSLNRLSPEPSIKRNSSRCMTQSTRNRKLTEVFKDLEKEAAELKRNNEELLFQAVQKRLQIGSLIREAATDQQENLQMTKRRINNLTNFWKDNPQEHREELAAITYLDFMTNIHLIGLQSCCEDPLNGATDVDTICQIAQKKQTALKQIEQIDSKINEHLADPKAAVPFITKCLEDFVTQFPETTLEQPVTTRRLEGFVTQTPETTG